MIRSLEATSLAHIETREFDESVLQEHCIDWNVKVVRVQACIDLSKPSASIQAWLLGVSIGKCVIDPSDPKCTIGGSVDGFKAEVTAEFDKGNIKRCLELCVPLGGCHKWCHTF